MLEVTDGDLGLDTGQLLWPPVCFPTRWNPSKNESILIGKNLLLFRRDKNNFDRIASTESVTIPIDMFCSISLSHTVMCISI